MTNMMKRLQLALLLSLMTCVVCPAISHAAETVYYLRADVTTVTMPDGLEIPMWGFAMDSAFGVEDGAVTIPGPLLTVPPGDTLKVVLQNKLTPGGYGVGHGMSCMYCDSRTACDNDADTFWGNALSSI